MQSADSRTLQISVSFPQGCYSGSDQGSPEQLPSPARLHEAFLAAAAGGPWARADGRVLVARDEHREALQWLEDHEPEGIAPPEMELTIPHARRHRWRASPVTPTETGFEPRVALDGPIIYVWPEAPEPVIESLRMLAPEITHVGRADSVAIVDVGAKDGIDGTLEERADNRGPGRVMRIPRRGRTDALIKAHAAAMKPGGHFAGKMGKQAPDELVTGANEDATELRRFAVHPGAEWPFSEVWQLAVEAGDANDPMRLLAPDLRVSVAVGIHRAIVNAIETNVPSFVTGRDGDGPLRGAGHLAIQLTTFDAEKAVVLLGIPTDVIDSDRDQLLRAIRGGLRARSVGRNPVRFALKNFAIRPAAPFWPQATAVMRTATPLVLDAPGRPRSRSWTLHDAVLCSVGYAMRGVLEKDMEDRGLEWQAGWAFRVELVRMLREHYDVRVVASRAHVSASRYVHRMRESELAVPVNAAVDLGKLAPVPGGFLALGRTRHLGGGLLVPDTSR